MERFTGFIDYLVILLSHFTDLGPIGGIALAMIEAFFPPLPLSLFVTINVLAFGFVWGYVYSLIGTITGSICVFFIIRKLGKKYIQKRIDKSRRLRNMFLWIHKRGFMPVFILLTFPFTPSIFVCGLAALADIDSREYIWATILGKMVMVLSLSFIGYNLSSFFQQPGKSLLLISMTLLISFIGKFAIGRYEKHLDKRHQQLLNDHKNLDDKND